MEHLSNWLAVAAIVIFVIALYRANKPMQYTPELSGADRDPNDEQPPEQSGTENAPEHFEPIIVDLADLPRKVLVTRKPGKRVGNHLPQPATWIDVDRRGLVLQSPSGQVYHRRHSGDLIFVA